MRSTTRSSSWARSRAACIWKGYPERKRSSSFRMRRAAGRPFNSPGGGEIDRGVDADPRHRELGRAVRSDVILQRNSSGAVDIDVARTIGAAQPNAHPLDFAPAVVDQMQSNAAGIAGQPSNDDFAAVDAQGPPLVRELTPDLQ